MRKQKRSEAIPAGQTLVLAESYALCERSSGIVRFRVDADSDGDVPVDKIAGFLAVHCLVRGQAPEDFELMVTTPRSLLFAVTQCAEQLLAAGRALGAGVKVSRREQEVLNGVLKSLANKEIASNLNVTERTVKFHVSSLLAKFGATDRVALSRGIAFGQMRATISAGQTQPHVLPSYPGRGRDVERHDIQALESGSPAAEGTRVRGRVFRMVPNKQMSM